ncbi:MAG TPA: hypothetical protein PLH87_13155 [Bacillota bacterium]|jgi:hypothetical protein|nr:hypothetical protein [Bacillota bacterium]
MVRRFILIGIIFVNLIITIGCYGQASYSPIVVDSVLLGGYANGKWYNADELYKLLSGKEVYKLYSINGYLGNSLSKNKDIDRETYFIYIDNDKYLNGCNVAISCNWDAQPRKPLLMNTNNDTYKQIVRKILNDNGLNKQVPVNITQLIKVDLEGDGIDEVIIAAENHKSPYALYNNDYSILVVRKIVDGTVKNIFLKKEIIKTSEEYIAEPAVIPSAVSILDTNDDGIMEIIINYQYYEGNSFSLYQIKNNKVNCLLSVTSGS